MNTYRYITLFCSLLLLSFFFSGTETAFFSLDRFQKKKLTQNPRGPVVIRLLEKPKRLLITLLIGNTLVNVALASFSGLYFETRFGQMGVLYSILVTTVFLLFISEITPKIIAMNIPERFALSAVSPTRLFALLVGPLTTLFSKLNQVVLSFFTEDRLRERDVFSREELKSYLLRSTFSPAIHSHEKQTIERILQFSDLTIDNLITPRTQMVCVPITATLNDLLLMIKQTGYTRIPVYQNSPDTIMGIVHAKDLLPYLTRRRNFKSLSHLIRPVPFVPELKKASALFREMLGHQQHLAITIDEFGGISGLITLQDLIEAIIGQAPHEWNSPNTLIEPLSKNSYRVHADISLDQFNQIFKLSLDDAEADTLGGFVFNLFGHLPQSGEQISWQNLTFTLESRSRTRMTTLVVTVHRANT